MGVDIGLETLLDLNGTVAFQGDNGYWIRIFAWRVAVSANTPHGVRYSLSLHNRVGERVLGYDNAHFVKPSGRYKFTGRRLPFDHRHGSISDRGEPYGFSTAYQLLADFFQDVERTVNRESNP